VEPLALHSPQAALIRAAAIAQPDLASVLRDGRVVAGEVLTTLSGDTVLIALGRHKVPAEAQVKLEPGNGYLFQVERGADGSVVLRLLPGEVQAESGLLRALRGAIAGDRPVGELLADLAARLSGRIAGERAASPGLAALLSAVESHVFRPGAGGDELARLLTRAGLSYEAGLLRAALRGGAPDELAQLAGDLKAELLRALSQLEAGPLRDAVQRALGGLEAEQLLNLARSESGEPLHWSLALPGGATAHLFVERDAPDEEDGEEQRDEGALRVVLGVELSALGPVRVDLRLRDDSVQARFLVADRALAERLHAGFAELSERLSSDERRVRLVASVGTPKELDVGAHAHEVEYLEQNRMLDVSG
jgi:hypothetical protein